MGLVGMSKDGMKWEKWRFICGGSMKWVLTVYSMCIMVVVYCSTYTCKFILGTVLQRRTTINWMELFPFSIFGHVIPTFVCVASAYQQSSFVKPIFQHLFSNSPIRHWQSLLLIRHANNTTNAVTSLHVTKGLVDVFERLSVGDELVHLELACHVVVDEIGKLSTALDATKGATLPHTPGDELERCQDWSAYTMAARGME